MINQSVKNERGMVLLLVLAVIALLSSLLTELAFSTLVDMRLTETFRDSTRAYYLAKGGIRVGRMILKEDRNEFDAPTELWGLGVSSYPVGEGFISIQVQDQGGKLDLNRLVTSQGNIDAVSKDRFLRLFSNLGLQNPEELVDSLIDWLDVDDRTEPSGAEDSYYLGLTPSRRAKNGPLDTMEELSLVRGFTPEILEPIIPHVTVHGQKKLNVNTATAEVLAAWDQDMDLGVAETIIESRQTKPFSKTDDLKDLLGVDTFTALNRNLDVGFTSDIYHITSWAGVNDGARTVEAVVSKAKNRLLFLKVN